MPGLFDTYNEYSRNFPAESFETPQPATATRKPDLGYALLKGLQTGLRAAATSPEQALAMAQQEEEMEQRMRLAMFNSQEQERIMKEMAYLKFQFQQMDKMQTEMRENKKFQANVKRIMDDPSLNDEMKEEMMRRAEAKRNFNITLPEGMFGRGGAKAPWWMQGLEGEEAGAAQEAYREKMTEIKPTVGGELAREMLKHKPFSPKWRELAKLAVPGTTIIMPGEPSPIEKATKTAVEKDIIEIEGILSSVEMVDALTQEDYLTYSGQIKTGWTRIVEKAKLGEYLPGEDPEFLEGYSAWVLPAQELYLKKRHEITGVAARPEEKEEIALAIPDPLNNSYTEFQSKSAQLKKILRKHHNRLTKVRAQGIENPTKEQLGKVPLEPEAPTQKYSIGQKIERGGKVWVVVGFDADGEPLVDEVK